MTSQPSSYVTSVQFPLFPMKRIGDRTAAQKAADAVRPRIGRIQREVITAYREHGAMTFTVAQELPEFARYGRSTIQKRISELSLMGILELVPRSKDATYRLVERRIQHPLDPESQRCPECGQLSRPKRRKAKVA